MDQHTVSRTRNSFYLLMKTIVLAVVLLSGMVFSLVEIVPQTYSNFRAVNLADGKASIHVPIGKAAFSSVAKGGMSLIVVFQNAREPISFNMAPKLITGKDIKQLPRFQSIQGTFSTTHPYVVVLQPNSPFWKEIQIIQEFYISMSGSNDNREATVSVYYGEVAQLEIGSRYHVNLQGQETFKYSTRLLRSDKPLHHYKFLVSAKVFTGDAPTLSGYGVKTITKDLTLQNHDFLFEKYDRQRLGIVFDKQHDSYCLSNSCEYKNAVITQGVSDLEVYNVEGVESEVLTVGQNTIGHIRANTLAKENLYAFKLQDRNSTIFTLIPIQGNAQLLVNPVSVPKLNEAFMYKADGPVGQRIAVSAFDMIGMSLPQNNAMLIAKVYCPSSCQYLLKSETQTEDIMDLTPGFTEAGTGHPGEIKQYVVAKPSSKISTANSKQSYFIKLQIASGDANLHIQVCQTSEVCQITNATLNKTETGLIHIVNKSPMKDIKIPLVCGLNRPATLETGSYYSDACAVLVAIETVPSNASTISRYEITVDEEEIPSVLNMNHQSYIHLLPQQTKKFVLNYHSSTSGQLDLNFIIDAKYGSFDCEVTPLSMPTQAKTVRIGTSHGMLSESYRRILFKVPANGMTETYNIVIKTAESSAGLILGISEVKEIYGPLVSRELKAGVPVTDHIHGHTQINYYSFKLVHNPDQQYETLRIKVNPIRGRFALVLRNDDTKPDLENNQWISYTDEITVTKDDPAFNVESFYVLGVVNLSPFGDDNLHPLFQIQWTTTDKTTMLLPGMFDSGALISTSQCFIAEIHSEANEILILKGGRGEVSLYMLLGDTHKTPSPENHIASCPPDKSGIYLKRSDIMQHCENGFNTVHHCSAYICVYGEKDVKYSVGYTINSQPMLLPNSKVIRGPLPIGNEVLRFIYHPSKDQSVDIEEFGEAMYTTIATKIVETNPQNNYKWPTADGAAIRPQTISNMIHITISDLAQFTNPLVLITLGRHPLQAANTQEAYNTARSFSLEAGLELKELIREVPRSGRAGSGEVRYFHFYSHNPNEPIVVTADSLNRADLDIFISRGKDSRPTADNNLVRSLIYGSSYVQIQKKDIQSKGFADFAGYYVVGVKATSDLEFTVRWSYLRGQIVSLSPNTGSTLYLDSEKPAYAKCYTQKQKNLKILVDSHHSKLNLLWTCIPNTYTVKSQNDLELFPTHLHHKKMIAISPASNVRIIKIPEAEMGDCDTTESAIHYFSLTTESENQVQVELKVMMQVPWAIETLNLNSRSIGTAEPGQNAKYQIHLELLNEEELRYYFLEVEMFDGSGSLSIKDQPFVFPNMPAAVELLKKDISVGVTTIRLEGVKGRFIKGLAIVTGKLELRTNFLAGVDIVCPASSCTYRLTARKSDWMSPLEVNSPREAFMPQAGIAETFVYACTGKEQKFDVSFVVENIGHPKINNLTDAQLKGIVNVFHVKRKEDLNLQLSTTLQSNVTHLDSINGRYGLEFPPVVGYFVLRISSLKEFAFSYRLEVNTDHYSRLIQGRQFMGIIDDYHDTKTYEFIPYRSDAIFAKINRCFGNYKVSEFNHQFTSSRDLPELESSGKLIEVLSSATPGEPFFIQVKKTTDQKDYKNQFGYLDDSKNISIFSIEAFESSAWNRIPFSTIAPYDEEMSIELHTNPPVLRFKPIKVPPEAYIDYKVAYYVVVSKDPEMVTYYLNCDKAYLNKVLKPGYTEDEAVQIYISDPNIETQYESTSLKPYHSMQIPVASGHKYFLAIYAQLEIKLQDKFPEKFTSNRLRIVYNTMEFEYQSFFYPIELIAATVGLIGIVVASCCVINTRWIRFMSKKMNGFQGVEHREVDQDLEEYFMRIKDDYQKEENKVRQKKKKRSNHSSPNISANSGFDNSSRLDESIVDVTADQPPTELKDTHASRSEVPSNSKSTEPQKEIELV
jgi:hypothetical protein